MAGPIAIAAASHPEGQLSDAAIQAEMAMVLADWSVPECGVPALHSFAQAFSHQLGHYLGLGHACEPGEACEDPDAQRATMYPGLDTCLGYTGPQLDDLRGLAALYAEVPPAGGAGPSCAEDASGAVDCALAEPYAEGLGTVTWRCPSPLMCPTPASRRRPGAPVAQRPGPAGSRCSPSPSFAAAAEGLRATPRCTGERLSGPRPWSYRSSM